MSGSTLTQAQAALAAAQGTTATAEGASLSAIAAQGTAIAALAAAQAGVASPGPTDNAATLLATLTGAQTAATQAELLVGITARALSAAVAAQIAANNAVLKFSQTTQIAARIAAAGTVDTARASIATAQAAYDAATVALEQVYAAGYPRPFDGAQMPYSSNLPIRVRTAAAETALWANV